MFEVYLFGMVFCMGKAVLAAGSLPQSEDNWLTLVEHGLTWPVRVYNFLRAM